jgi:uncharacterized protein
MAAGLEIPQNEAERAPSAAQKLAALEARLKTLDQLMVAYSGGVDSAFLAATAHRVMGERMLAVLADSPSLARRDMEEARKFAAKVGIPLEVVATEELSDPEYARNDANRCFHCKDALFTTMEALGEKMGYRAIAFGMNLDDKGDYRPGQRAAAKHEVLAPLAEAGMTKADVRLLAREAGFALWDRPAAPCLSSRIEYGRPVTREALAQVEQGEEWLRIDDGDDGHDHGRAEGCGLRVCNARLQGLPLGLVERDSSC